jgi:hypothetical protein
VIKRKYDREWKTEKGLKGNKKDKGLKGNKTEKGR